MSTSKQKNSNKRGRKLKNFTGKTQGLIHVIGIEPTSTPNNPTWQCACEHALNVHPSIITLSHRQLLNGIRSCGCLRQARFFKHGYASRGVKSSIYTSWMSMKKRCDDLMNPFYGGKGITYPESWKQFLGFLKDMGGAWPGPGFELGRIDHGRAYSKENCSWASNSEQAYGRYRNVERVVNGRPMTQAELMSITGITNTRKLKRELESYGNDWMVLLRKYAPICFPALCLLPEQ